ncbi:MAG: M20/M25/M40 family metallo-hydrolase [Nitriliruptoraceae bacterium]
MGAERSVRDELVDRLLEHLGWMCVTGEEGPIAEAVAAHYAAADLPVQRVGESLVVGAPDPEDDRPLVLLVGHLDVVPPTDDDLEPRIETRGGQEIVVGRGASDMKAGNVVAMDLFEDVELRAASPYQLALVLYAGEEGGADANQLRQVLAAVPWLADAALAVVLEPTDGQVQLGCLGGLHALLTFQGRQAHSARPWHGRNALTLAGPLLTELEHDPLVEVEVDGITYHDVWSATQAWSEGLGPDAGTSEGLGPDAGARPDTNARRAPARNIIPATFTINLNFRFAPSRGLAAAEEELRAYIGERATIEITDRVPAAPPRLDHPVVASFVAAVGAEVAGKQAWTDVARFAEIEVPALNYGPGLTAQAHQRGEYVPVAAVVDAATRLRAFLRGSDGAVQ